MSTWTARTTCCGASCNRGPTCIDWGLARMGFAGWAHGDQAMRACPSRRSGVGVVSGSGSWEPVYDNKMNGTRNLLRTELLRPAFQMFVWS